MTAPATTSEQPKPKPRRGPPNGNQNARKHGARSVFTLSRLPRGCSHISRYLRGLLAKWEDALRAKHGQVSVVHAAMLNTALRHEFRAKYAERYFRREEDKRLRRVRATIGENGDPNELPADDDAMLSIQDRICAASEARDKILRRLGLDDAGSKHDPFEQLYRRPRLAEPPAAGNGHQSTQTAQDAADAATRDDSEPSTEGTQ